MNDLDFYRQRSLVEAGLTGSVLKQLVPERMDYRPHAKSPTAGQLFWTIIRGLQIRLNIVQSNEADGPPAAPHPPYEEMLASYLDLSKQLEDELPTVDESRWARKAEFRMNGRVALDWPVGEILWMFHFDVIHHRGQLTAYLRPMGGRVPSIYGKSGDDVP
jgi:uncharacterized damage-inducible protein DinB